MITIDELKKLFPLTMEESVVTQHIKRASMDYKGETFTEDEELEIVGSKAMYYLSPLLWVDMQNRVAEYEESMSTFRDVEKFQAYWLERCLSAYASATLSTSADDKQIAGNLQWAAV